MKARIEKLSIFVPNSGYKDEKNRSSLTLRYGGDRSLHISEEEGPYEVPPEIFDHDYRGVLTVPSGRLIFDSSTSAFWEGSLRTLQNGASGLLRFKAEEVFVQEGTFLLSTEEELPLSKYTERRRKIELVDKNGAFNQNQQDPIWISSNKEWEEILYLVEGLSLDEVEEKFPSPHRGDPYEVSFEEYEQLLEEDEEEEIVVDDEEEEIVVDDDLGNIIDV